MWEWKLNSSNSDDRNEFIRITKSIYNDAEEVRRIPWKEDAETGKRTVEVNAYIKGQDIVLVDDAGQYVTTMKDGINNIRVKGGKSK